MPSFKEILNKGNYRARFASAPGDLVATLALRSLCFGTQQSDLDSLDQISSHVLVEDWRTDELVCCFRVLSFSNGSQLSESYSAQFYDLSALEGYAGPMIELGRFCIHPSKTHPDILRLAWGALTRLVDDKDVQMLFGCSSFSGTKVDPYLEVFKLLKERHLAPDHWRPRIKMENVFLFSEALEGKPDVKRAIAQMPPLLRSYLMMGGWVSDHAVVDSEMNTLHVFTGLQVDAIPATRKQLLRSVADTR